MMLPGESVLFICLLPLKLVNFLVGLFVDSCYNFFLKLAAVKMIESTCGLRDIDLDREAYHLSILDDRGFIAGMLEGEHKS